MNKRKSLMGIGMILALMALTGYLLLKDLSLNKLAGILVQVRPGWLLLGLGLMVTFVGCEAMCSRLILGRLGHPVRSLRTQFARNYAKAEYGGMNDADLEALGTGALRRAVQEGDNEHGCFLSGQIAAMVKREQPAADIVREVMEEAEPILRRAQTWVE